MCKLFVLSSTNIVPMDSAGLIQIRHYIQGSNWRLGSSGDNLHRYSTSFLLLNTGSLKCIFMTIFKSHLLDSFHMSLSPQFYYLSPILFLSSIHLSPMVLFMKNLAGFPVMNYLLVSSTCEQCQHSYTNHCILYIALHT